MQEPASTQSPKTIISIIAAGLAALGASLCCLGPLLLVSLGLGGSWMSSLNALEPYRPLFIGFAVIFLFLAFRKLYFLSDESNSMGTDALRKQRTIFWIIYVLAIALITFPYYGMLLLE